MKKLIDCYCLDEETKKELELEDEKEYLLFEWDCDKMIFQEDWKITEYVDFYWHDDLVITDWAVEHEEELLEFFENDENWISFEEQTWQAFNEYNWLKIAYRWWVGYVYHLYYYNFKN